jgi:hypothetical protein
MAIFTAIQATQAVTTLATTTADQAHQELIAKYQDIFDFIQTASGTGKTTINWTLSKSAYTEILPDLISAGYTVSGWPVDITDTAKSSTVTITWPSATPVVVTYPSITAIAPTQITGAQNVYFSAVFKATGGTAPYTYAITGTVPTGLSWSTLTSVDAITLSGTPTQPATEYSGFVITATDAHSKTLSQTVTWDIAATNILNISTQTPGTEALSYNPNNGVLTFTPYGLPTSTSTQLGGVKIDNSTITTNAQGQIQYVLPTATTTTLGAVKVDGTSIQAANGVISLIPTTLDTRIRTIAIAISVAFGV